MNVTTEGRPAGWPSCRFDNWPAGDRTDRASKPGPARRPQPRPRTATTKGIVMNTLNGVEYTPAPACEQCGAPFPGGNAGLHATFLPGDWNRKVTQLCATCKNRPENRTACGTLCTAHFDYQRKNGRPATMADVEACAYCQAARRRERERIQQTHTIDPEQEYGAHIALTCRNHPELSWHTKNIDYIGARSIFFSDWGKATECDCPVRDLIVAK